MFNVPKNVVFSGDIVIFVVAVIGVDDTVLVEEGVEPELNRLRLTVPYDVELNLSAIGIAEGDCCIAKNKQR